MSRTHRRRIPKGLVRSAIIVALVAALLAAASIIIGVFSQSPDRVRGEGKSYGLPVAEVDMYVRADGSIDVTEHITFSFDGPFSGAFRDIPLRTHDDVSDVLVCDSGGITRIAPSNITRNCADGAVGFAPGATTELGSTDVPGRFGTERLTNPDGADSAIPYVQRVVWHYRAADELRTFAVQYRATGWVRRVSGDPELLAIELTPWGQEWLASLGNLTARIHFPAGSTVRPRTVERYGSSRGGGRVETSASIAPDRDTTMVQLDASNLLAGERVDLLLLLPAAQSGITASVQLAETATPAQQLRDEARERVDASTSRTRRLDWLATRQSSLAWIATLGGLLLAGALSWLAWTRVLREDPWPAHVERLAADPPTPELSPAEAVCLVDQHRSPPDAALVATIFDLVRRGYWKLVPAQGDAPGVQVDIALIVPESRPALEQVRPWEKHALKLVDTILKERSEPIALGEFHTLLRGNLSLSRRITSINKRFEESVATAVRVAAWLEHRGTRWLRIPTILTALLVITSIVVLAAARPIGWSLDIDPRMLRLVASLTLAAAGSMCTLMLFMIASRMVRTRYRPKARETAARWVAYRDFLDAYADMADEQTASIELWEQHLVYAIAFGSAEDILASVRPHGVEELSSLGSLTTVGPAALPVFSSGLASRAPTPSSSGGSSSFGGGGFGGGGGGGGGGAW